jgi:hypothetical protein
MSLMVVHHRWHDFFPARHLAPVATRERGGGRLPKASIRGPEEILAELR